MRSRLIHDTSQHTVTSYGNGLAYVLADKHTGHSVLFQGDDARTFEDQLRELTEGRLTLSYTNALAYIWEDYRDVAQAA